MAKTKKKKSKKTDGASRSSVGGKAARRLKTITENPLIADVVAAALVATASALKDSRKARQLAAHAGDELEALAKEGAERGNAMWKLALEVGRRAIDTIGGDEAKPSKKAKPAKTAKPSPKSTRRAK